MTLSRLPRTAAVLGGGAVGGVLLPALRTIGVRVVAAWSRTPKTAQWRGGALPRGLREAELILLAVSDGAIAPLCAQLVAERLIGPGQFVAHLAGALDLQPLATALAAGAKVGSIHPLRAVPPGSRADALSGAAAGIEGSDDDMRGMLHALAQALHMLPLAAAGSRALYHAAAVLAGGAQVALFSEAVRAFQSATGASEPDARAALLPLAKGAIDTLAARAPSQAITGPVTRGDAETVVGHLKALESHDARTAAIYRQLSQAALELTRSGARATPAQLAPVGAALTAQTPASRAATKPLPTQHAASARPASTRPAASAKLAATNPAAPPKSDASPPRKTVATKAKPAAKASHAAHARPGANLQRGANVKATPAAKAKPAAQAKPARPKAAPAMRAKLAKKPAAKGKR